MYNNTGSFTKQQMYTSSLCELFKDIKVKEPEGWLCPQCGGSGSNCDGNISIGPRPGDFEIQPASKCNLCNGKGRVLITPLPD